MVQMKDLDMFVTVQLIEDIPAVLFLGKPREENGYSGTPNLIRHCKIVPCKCDRFVPIVVPSLSSEADTPYEFIRRFN